MPKRKECRVRQPTSNRLRESLSPSFAGLYPASKASSLAKRHNQATKTSHELLLQKTLSSLGIKFRKNVRDIPGKPDLVFVRGKVVVFCDGDFWHGRNWPKLRPKLKQGTNGSYWEQKIRGNILRDRKITNTLKASGWSVLRFWESDIKANPEKIANVIINQLSKNELEVNAGR